MYDNASRIYFTEDSIDFSFGTHLEDFVVLKIPVKLMGNTSKTDRSFKLRVNTEKSTSEELVNHEPLLEQYLFPQSELTTEIDFKIYRTGITGEDFKTVVLELVENEDFKLGVKESVSIKIKFNNFLEKPDWWYILEYYTGGWHPAKYQKFIQIHGSPIVEDDIMDDFMGILGEWKQVYEYFKENPQEGVEFDDNVYWP
jgi:hypothetical protein